MLINCRPGCSGKKVTTEGKLDVEQDEVVCTYCNEVISASNFTKMSMKRQGDIIKRDSRKSFQFNCLTCKKKVETVSDGKKLTGLNCKNNCQFNVSKFTIHAMNSVAVKVESQVESELEEEYDDVSQESLR
jgi:DNA-directed RNA polymerase subunit RPC12/RpoP